MRRLLMALAFVGCDGAEPLEVSPVADAAVVAAAPLLAPLDPVRVDDLVFDSTRRRGDALRGLGAVHGIYLGEEIGRSRCFRSHEIRIGDVIFPVGTVCGHARQFVGFRAWRWADGQTVDVTELIALLTTYMGAPEVRGSGPTWSQTWRGNEVAVVVRINEGRRLEVEAALRASSVGRMFEHRWPQTLDDLDTTARSVDPIPRGSLEASRWDEFVAANVPAPRIACALRAPTGVVKALLLTASEPIWVPVIDGWASIPVGHAGTFGVVDVEGFGSYAVSWTDERAPTRCDVERLSAATDNP